MAQEPDPDSRSVEILFEGGIDDPRPPGVLDHAEVEIDAPLFHEVGVDRLGAAIAVVADSVTEARDRRAEAATLGMAGQSDRFSDLLPERTAQVVQATPVPARLVIALLEAGDANPPDALTLKLRPIRSSDGVAVFDGYLRLRRPRTRRRIELRVYPTSSGNLAVLELLPSRVWMPQTRRYLAAGVPAISRLTDVLEAAADGQRQRRSEHGPS